MGSIGKRRTSIPRSWRFSANYTKLIHAVGLISFFETKQHFINLALYTRGLYSDGKRNGKSEPNERPFDLPLIYFPSPLSVPTKC